MAKPGYAAHFLNADVKISSGNLEVPDGEITWSPNIVSYDLQTTLASETCTEDKQHTFCALLQVRQRHFTSSATFAHCWVRSLSTGWQLCVQGNSGTEISCRMLCF